MKYTINLESDNAEQDLANIVEIFMNAMERGVEIYKDAKSTDNEAQALKTFKDLNQNVADLGTKLSDLNFKEVETKTSSNKDIKK